MEGVSRTLLGSSHAGRVSIVNRGVRVCGRKERETKVRKNNRVGGASD